MTDAEFSALALSLGLSARTRAELLSVAVPSQCR